MGQGKTALVTKLSVENKFDRTKFVFNINHDFKHKSFVLTHPNRLVIDIKNARSNITFDSKKLSNTPVKKIRHALHNHGLRLVFDLKGNPKIKIDYAKHHPVGTYQLMVNVAKPVHSVKDLSANNKPQKKKKIAAVKVIPKVTKKTSLRDIVIVIDPGHGGKDPGAHGIKGTREKNVVLAIAKKLQNEINKEPGFKAILTRKGDYYIGLRQRLVLAHKYKADMFVAIHADAYLHNRAHGASVYALSERGATSEAARWLAKKENESEFVGGLELNNKDYLVRSVLIDLSQTHTIGVSLQMGSDILYEMAKFAALHHPGVEQAAFVVLKSPDIPSLLVETGFLSNAKEEHNLVNPHYQNKIALAVKRGVISYFVSHPPRGTRLAYLRKSRSRT